MVALSCGLASLKRSSWRYLFRLGAGFFGSGFALRSGEGLGERGHALGEVLDLRLTPLRR